MIHGVEHSIDPRWLADAPVRDRRRRARRRGARCATQEVTHLLIGGRLLAVGSWSSRPWRCHGRVERGHRYCVNCRAVQRAQADAAEANA